MSKWKAFTRSVGLSRTNQVLVGLLVVQLVLVVVFLWPDRTPITTGASLFADLDVSQVVGLTFTSKDGDRLVLAKELGNWVLPDAERFPCDETKVANLLDQIAGLTSDRLVAQTRGSHKRLGVDARAYELLVEIELAGGEVRDLYIGTSPSYQVSHVRKGDQEQVYMVSGLSTSTVSARATMWVDTTYMTLSRDEIVGVTLENANGQFEFTKVETEGEGEEGEKETSWTMTGLAEGEVLDETGVTSVISSFGLLRMIRPLGKEELDAYGMQAPTATIRLHVPDEDGSTKVYVVRVGAYYPDESAYVVKSGTSSYYVLVSEYTAKLWIDKMRDDFIQEPPTPTPEAES
jgi:hypothetical protein